MAVCSRSTTTENSSALFLCVAILLGSQTTSSFAAPSNSENGFWSNPCTRQQVQQRHGRSPSEDQLYMFSNKMDFILRDLRMLYHHASTGVRKEKGGQCLLKLGKLMNPIKRAKNSSEAIQEFYVQTIQLAKFLRKLSDMKIKTPSQFNTEKRKSIFKETKENLRLVICEYDEKLLRLDLHPTLPRGSSNAGKCSEKFMDLSSVQMRDFDFFHKLKKFLKQSFRKLMRLKKTGKGHRHGKGKRKGNAARH